MDQVVEKKAMLEVSNLEVVYNNVITAVQGVSLSVPEGDIVSILGVNGAGKTTTLRALSGFLPSEDARIANGTIRFLGRRLEGMTPNQIVRMGMAMIPERDKVFSTLTVGENLRVTSSIAREGSKELVELVYKYFPILKQREKQLAGYLSGGERQMLAIGRTLICSPKLLLVDELSLGLAPRVVIELSEALRNLHKELGLAILLVEQNAALALGMADFCYVMENGKIVFEGTPQRLAEHEDVKEFYLGMSEGKAKSYRDVKQYRRTRRW